MAAKPWMQAAPRPFFGPRAQAGADGVEEDVVDRCGQVVVGVDDPRGVAIAPQVAATLVAPVERERVRPVQQVHPAGHRLDGRLEDEVVMGRHQAVRVDVPAEALDAVPHERKEAPAVKPVAEDGSVVDAEGRDVEDTVGQDRPKEARHRAERTPPASGTAPAGLQSHTFVTKNRSFAANT
jgi:hypothetical protein